MADFTLPELGENVTAGDILRVLVKPGDTLEKDQPVLELETDKATIEVPSSVAGQVKEIKVKAGDKVKVGQAILSVVEAGNGAGSEKSAAPENADTPDKSGAPEKSGAAEKSGSVRLQPDQATTKPETPADKLPDEGAPEQPG